jgi:hypothetical protein
MCLKTFQNQKHLKTIKQSIKKNSFAPLRRREQ